EMGPMIHADAAALVRAQREDALARGARVIATAPVPAKPDGTAGDSGPAPVTGDPAGALVAPTVLADVTDDMRVMREETFGPLLPVTRVADLDEAVARANAT